MKKVFVFLGAVVNFILMSTILQEFRIFGVMANFIIIFSMIYALLSSSENAYIFAIVSGLLQDTFLGKVLFVNTIIYITLVYLARRFGDIMFKGNDLTPLFITALATVLYHFLFFVFMFFLQSSIPLHLILDKMIIETILNSIIGLLLYRILFKNVFGYKLGDYNA